LRQPHADCYSYTDGHSNIYSDRYSPTHAHAEISADTEAPAHAATTAVACADFRVSGSSAINQR